MKKNNYLTIKEFSNLTHTPIDTLKHYDRIDLLKPAYIGENSYRYYLPEQAFLLTRILFGVKAKVLLSDIKNIILNDSPDKSYNHYIHIEVKEKVFYPYYFFHICCYSFKPHH